MIEAICREIDLQKDYLVNPIETIYFGGGTPSLLTEKELFQILDRIYKRMDVVEQPEITLEANPDDLTKSRVDELRKSPVNRLSIGIQSFHDPHLKFMNRAHTAQEAMDSVDRCRNAGFQNFNLDLIYGIPANSDALLQQDLETFFSIGPDHISAYGLTIEEKTVFGNWTKKGKLLPIEDDFTAHQFEMVMTAMQEHGYEQYEISNFCQSGKYSRHNSSYWLGAWYLGIGPGAHSYNGTTRSFNGTNNAGYIRSINKGLLASTVETLSRKDKINDYLLTGIRTRWGIDLNYLNSEFQFNLLDKTSAFEQDGLIQINQNILTLTPRGRLIADFIAERFFIDS